MGFNSGFKGLIGHKPGSLLVYFADIIPWEGICM